MKKNLLLLVSVLFVFISGYSQTELEKKSKKEIKSDKIAEKNTVREAKALRKKHAKFLKSSDLNNLLAMSKSDRLAAGLPPNKYFEQDQLLSMNPALGRPTPENIGVIRADLQRAREQALSSRIPGDAVGNNWVERGPNNVGGRTRAIIFDPTDATGNTVIAGGVSGGLWKNTNIASAATAWTRMSLAEHLNVQNITIDPNNSSTWYVGTGESYTQGDVNGNGIWKTTDAGATWTRVFGGGTPTSTQQYIQNLAIISPSNAGVIALYNTTIATAFGSPITASVSAPIVLVNDGAAGNNATTGYPLSTEGCGAYTAGSLTGKIALIRRGTCSFESKAFAAQTAGAIGVIIMNNQPGGPIGMAEDALVAATIPTLMISQADGDLLVANLANLTGTFQIAQPGTFYGTAVSNIQFINDLAIKNNGGTSEIYAAVGDGYNAGAYLNFNNYGVFKSTDGGSTWTKLILPTTASGNQTCPNDIEIAVDGKIWVSSTDSTRFRDGGGNVFVSMDGGVTFTLKHTVTGYVSGTNGTGGRATRVEIEASNVNANVIYVLSQLEGVTEAAFSAPVTEGVKVEVKLEKTTDGFATTPTILALPTSVYSSPPASSPPSGSREYIYGFTGAQAFYDLMIETDPTNDQILYVGGIDLFRSTNGGSSWNQISQWTADVHSDQHAMVFKPGNSNIGLFGNDGGVYYSGSLSTTGTPATSRNKGFNVTQFVGVAVMPNGVAGVSNDFFVAGAQDNGSNYFPSTLSTTVGATVAINGSSEVQGGDGGKPLFAQDSDKYYVTNYVYNDNMFSRGLNGNALKTLSDGNKNMGLFYPAMELDSANDIVYSDFTNSTTGVFQIRRYTNVKATGILSRTTLSNALLNYYPTALKVGKVTPTTLYAGTGGGRLLKIVSANNTAGTWSDISTGSGFVGSISDIEFGANDSQIFVTMQNYGVTSVWYTPNGGTNWYSIEGNLPDLPVRCILQNPLNSAELMIGTELGVWYANTFNPATAATQALNWVQAYNGMSNVKVTDLDLQPNSPTAPTAYNVFAATYGRGVFSGPLTNVILSVNENSLVSNAIKVYPTASNGNITITATKVFGQTKLNLFDISGKNVYSNTINLDNAEQKINLGNLSSGNYILKLSGDGFEDTKRIIIE
jgi:hypothetical protein